jgi:acyl-CoA thioesterase-1
MKSVLQNSLVVVLAVGVVSAACFCASDAIGQEAATKKKPAAKRKRAPNPAFQPPEIQEGLPNVLLIGDSISIGYMIPARDALKGVANVWRPPTNCGPTTNGVKNLESWLGDRKWDVIHFNFGLHDLKYMGPKGQNLADPKAADSKPQVPLDQYVANLQTIAKRLKKTGAVVIWRQTTPVPDGAKGRVVGDSVKYNEAAAKVMEEIGGIQTDAMYDYAVKEVEILPANVHYSKEGSAKLGKHVAEVVKKTLPMKSEN